MTATSKPPPAPAPASSRVPAVEGSAYELIKARLDAQGLALQQKVNALNARRAQVFGGVGLSIVANERVRTENNCIPRDILNVGGRLLFGYNVFIGLRKETHIEDVFALHRCERTGDGWNLDALPTSGDHADAAADFLRDPRFVKDFTELYRYYKEAELLQLRLLESGKLLAVFKTGPSPRDLKVLRWAVDRIGNVRYVDNNGLEDHTFPPTHSFEWTRCTRENHVTGRFPHVNILDTVFVETMGGDLTIKVENNTASGQGIYSEPVDDRSQSLDDAQFHYARVGALILIRVLPYREQAWRHFVFNTRTREAWRIDAIAQSCVELPEDHGIIFPGGFALATGEVKTFVGGAQDGAAGERGGLTFKRMVRAANGEDVLYEFYEPASGRRVLLAYNLIDKEVRSPIHCHGWSLFDDGTVIAFRAEGDEPTRVHPMRIWQTPFMSPLVAAQQQAAANAGSLFVKVGNPEAVRAISDAHTLRRMIGNQKPSVKLYEDLVAEATRVLDSYPWLKDQDEVGDVATTVSEIRATAELVIDEFEKVLAIQRAAVEALRKAEERQRQLASQIRPDSFRAIDPFLEGMKALRTQRGHLVSLMEERYIDVPRLKALEGEAAAAFDELTRKAGVFLQDPAALKPYRDKHEEIVRRSADLTQAAEARPLIEELDRVQAGLQLLTEVTGQLKIDDAQARTQILEDIAAVIAQLNRARAVLDGRRRDLLRAEGAAELAAQAKLLGQAIESSIAMADTPERCEQELARLLVTVEELEGRFSGLDDAVVLLGKKREEIFEALTARKQHLLDERNRRAQNLLASAQRILEGIKRRALASKSADELNATLAADPMVEKARAVAEELAALGDSVKSEEVLSKLKAVRAEATRQVRDKAEIFVDGADLVQLGKHRFTVNTQAVDLTMLPRPRADGSPGLALHLTGTDYFEPVEDADLLAYADLFEQPLVSESPEVARAEHLAMSVLLAARESGTDARLEEARHAEGGLAALVAEAARQRYDEGYDRGVHDTDAARILEAVLHLERQAGMLRHGPRARALAVLFWAGLASDEARRAQLHARARGAARVLLSFPHGRAGQRLLEDLGQELQRFLDDSGVAGRLGTDARDARAAATYLVEEVGAAARAGPAFVLSPEAQQLVAELFASRDTAGEGHKHVLDDIAALDGPGDRVALGLAWLEAFVAGLPPERRSLTPSLLEAVAHLVTRGQVERAPSGGIGAMAVEGLVSQHPRIAGGRLLVRLDEFTDRVGRFIAERVPRFHAFKRRRLEVIEAARRRLRLQELEPRVLSSFVRNKLVNDVYLPLVGDNLAKQMGAAGAKKRTDLMGMLLLVSPPGYGKTTLMEYVASRLGLVYVKANGPALGHDTTSLDPAEAPNATARQEVEKINFAFEMGNNVLLLLDDIQHTHPELLQKFISLCDGTRRVEGVWRGTTRTYDLRGKKFVVCMAGNPYTESGEKFRIPDMLANRADTYNLGDILGGREREFALSYLENALTSSPVLQPLAARDPADVDLLVRMAQGEEVPTTDLKHGYSGAELDEIVRVLKKLMRVQATLLKVNAAYIASAATDDRFRAEPPFKLQGSYRNMNKITEKVVAVMNDDELEQLLDDHYRGEAQTLTTGAEHNLLKLAELRGRMTPEQQARWRDIKAGFERVRMQGSHSDDPATRVTNTLAGIAQRVEAVTAALAAARLDVHVTNPSPEGLAELVRLQTILIEASLLPLVRGMASSLEHERGNAERLEEALTSLRAIEARGAAGLTSSTSVSRTPFSPAAITPSSDPTETG